MINIILMLMIVLFSVIKLDIVNNIETNSYSNIETNVLPIIYVSFILSILKLYPP